jgi:hypothetical protein
MIAAITIPAPTAIPAMAPLPSCALLEELLVALLLDDDEGCEPPLEEVPPEEDPADVSVADVVAVDCTEDSGLVTVPLDSVPVGTLLKDVAEVPPIWVAC